MSKILRLESENVKRVKAVSIEPGPDGGLVVVCGDNEQGKTSVLDTIAMLLGGATWIPRDPVRHGEKSARAYAQIDDGHGRPLYEIERTIREDRSTKLVIKRADGAPVKAPQGWLDAMLGPDFADAMQFASLRDAERIKVLRPMVELDLEAHDQERERVYAKRTDVNRDVKRLETLVRESPPDPKAPTETVDVTALMADLDRIASSHDAHRQLGREIEHAEEMQAADVESFEETKREMEELQAKSAAISSRIAEREQALVRQREAFEDSAAALEEPEPIRQAIEDAEGVNARYRENAERTQNVHALSEKRKESGDLTAQIDELDRQRVAAIAETDFGVEGLDLTPAGEVLYKGVPFDQASHEERAMCGVAIALKRNPEIRVILLREGSFFDDEHLAKLGDMAAAADAQLWVEVVGDREAATVVIEDGTVKETR